MYFIFIFFFWSVYEIEEEKWKFLLVNVLTYINDFIIKRVRLFKEIVVHRDVQIKEKKSFSLRNFVMVLLLIFLI